MANQILLKALRSMMTALFRRILWVLVFSVGMCVAPQETVADGEFYRGTVVDAETGEPLEGAVVTIIWFKKPYLALDSGGYIFHSAKEVLTDAGGKFSVDASPGRNWNPFTYMTEQPWVVIFKPGYGPLTRAYPRGLEHIFEELKKGAIVRLPKLKTREELREFSDHGSLGIHPETPGNQIPNLIHLINVQRKNLGFDPIR